MSEEIPLSPIGREEIHKLEYALLVGTLFRPEVLEELRNPSERLTWVDSLAVAAAAIAREKAKMTISQIAEDIGRTESTIRNHLTGKTKAGQLVRQTLEKFLREGVKIDLPSTKELEELKVRLEEERKKSQKLEILLQEVKNSLKDLVEKLEKI
ncbi:MAG: transcriptional regulator [Thaumarchaeota archaeon]|nr:transcriptional regulator [Candidatus Geocrenenecus arthurdayi]MCL7390580.1 transcriptional regulator [Candidatus Geocrenenecus arthurdayi]MCL7396650.1 transcriptional regulator [Candidatus Geocrenenecus arthurdayi]MCL7403248.1 transcriptional regulator [Candidatus Geocrenenecus arthurdayi]